MRANQAEEVWCDRRALRAFGPVATGEPVVVAAVGGKLLEGACRSRPVQEIGRVDPAIVAGGGIEVSKVDQRVGARKRQRLEDPGLDHAEHGRGAGDADGKRQHGDRGQPRCASKRARGVLDVLGDVFERGQALLLAIALLERLDAATASGSPRGGPRQATARGGRSRRCGAGDGFQSRRPFRARAGRRERVLPRESSTLEVFSRRLPPTPMAEPYESATGRMGKQ